MAAKYNFRKTLKIFTYMIGVLFVLLVVIIAILIFGYMENTVTGRGVFEGFREYQLKSAVLSRIKTVAKHEGDSVKKGDILLCLDDRDLREKIELLKHKIKELKSEIDVAEAEFAIKKHDPLPKEYRHTRIALQTAELRCKKSEIEQKMFQNLYDRKVISLLKLQQSQLKHLTNMSDFKAKRKDYMTLENGLAKKIIAKAASELALLKTWLNSKKSEFKSIFRHLDDYIFTAPDDGIIRYIPPKPGAYVVPGDTLVRLATMDKKKFIVYVNEKQIFRIQEGQTTRIASSQYNYLEYGYFEGKVLHIGGMPELRGGQNYYPVKIMLVKEPQALRLGSTGEAYIVTGKERIIFCLSGWNK
ncbi:HlyD family efflux transporter periplasmic adaptor subunit [Candidatus Parcubacteria bacterium]|nr:HlyD family efflux transporter periplasmic adaptor subunit [Candidatus Parcubacteria bacterium]